jgi:hypothetical protein
VNGSIAPARRRLYHATMKRLYVAAAVALSVLLAGPASGAVTLDPPAGWKALDMSSSPFHPDGFWAANPTLGFAQNISLAKFAAPGTTFDGYVTLNQKQLLSMDPKLLFAVDRDEPCGATIAHRFKYQMTMGAHRFAVEQLMVQDGEKFVIGTYTRLVEQPPLPEASTALGTMCAHIVPDASATPLAPATGSPPTAPPSVASPAPTT